MKIILDTNVLVSAVFFGGIPGRLLEAWVDGAVTLVLSPDIFEEYRRVGHELSTCCPERGEIWDSVLIQIATHAILINAPKLDGGIADDPDDNKFFACAKASQSAMIISGDRHLLKVSGWNEISVLTPRQFYDRYLK
jgi:uncharacterized protein